jgi:cbb3-type cytochrome oxidase maturation protein
MNILYFLVGCSVVMALLFLGAFIWSLKNGQHDDVVTPGMRVLFDDEVDPEKNRRELKCDKDHFLG